MKKKLLVTGFSGMIGTEFSRQAREKGYEVIGLARSSAASRKAAIQEPGVITCDILDPDAVEEAVLRTKPDLVAHFAAQAFNGASWQMERLTHETNTLGTLNILKACKKHAPDAKILLACSSAEYGIVPDKEQPIKEQRLLRPLTPYGVSKLATEALGYQYFINYGMKIYLPRLFIHVGTGHPPATMIQNFARQIALIARKKIEPVIKVGVLDTRRDFIDVRDGVAAQFLILEKGKPGEPINIATGGGYSGREILNKLLLIAGVKAKIIEDKSLLRPSDEKLLVGDNSQIKKLGWKQKYSIDGTLKGVYEDWLSRI